MKLVSWRDIYKLLSQKEFSFANKPNFSLINFIPLNLLNAYSAPITETSLSHDTSVFLMWNHLQKKNFCMVEMPLKSSVKSDFQLKLPIFHAALEFRWKRSNFG